MSIFAVKTTKSEEQTVADMIMERDHEDVHAAFVPEGMVSYLIIEAENTGPVERMLDEIPHANSILNGNMSLEEIEHFFESKSDVRDIHENDIVEVSEGPFSGEKAQVQSIDESNEQVTVELLEATVPIPVTVKGNQIRVLDSEER